MSKMKDFLLDYEQVKEDNVLLREFALLFEDVKYCVSTHERDMAMMRCWDKYNELKEKGVI